MIVNSNGEVVMDCIEIKHNLEEFEKLKKDDKIPLAESLVSDMVNMDVIKIAIQNLSKIIDNI